MTDDHADLNRVYRAAARQFLADVKREGVASIRLVEWSLEDPDELALRRSVGFRYCPAVDITLGGSGARWRFSGHEAEGTLQPCLQPGSSVEATSAWTSVGIEVPEVFDAYHGLSVESAGFGGMADGSVVSLEIRFAGAENLYLFACEFDDDNADQLSVGEEMVVLCTSCDQAARVGLVHQHIEVEEGHFECG